MAGLSSAYITWKLSAEGTTPATRDLILTFINAAPNAAAIVGIEPVEGPVVDDRTEYYGDPVRHYDIGLAVAQSIIAERNVLAGFTHLTQVTGLSHFGADKLADLIFPFTRGNLTVTVATASEEPPDVAAIAKRLDSDLTESPTTRELEANDPARAAQRLAQGHRAGGGDRAGGRRTGVPRGEDGN